MDKKSFKDLYHEAAQSKPKVSPAQLFIEEVAALTHRSVTTVRMWIYGHQEPDSLIKAVIAEHFKVDASYLFPPKTSNQ